MEKGKSVRSPPLEEEGATETTCNELTATPCTTGREDIEKIGSEVEPRKKGGVRRRCF